MRSRTSFYNGTLFRKNLTRFAPVWGLYTLCLVVGLFMEYTNTEVTRFWFAYHLGRTTEVMAFVNAGYALLVAQLLFGDLYTSRMCNMLHALPLRREGWFLTNLASGMVMSLVPTAVMTIFSWVLLANTIFQNAWAISLGVFLASNLQFILFFGLASFAAMATANRFAMAAGYGLLNFGAEIVYFLVDTVYTPMLYGVVTPRTLVNNLTPLNSLQGDYFTTTAFEEVIDETHKLLPGAVATFRFSECWLSLFLWTAVGLLFLALALVLYRRRHLECAGDAVAFPILKPVFNVLCALFVVAASVFVPKMILGLSKGTFLFLSLGLIVGWFMGKMLLERSTRVFRLKNWYGLAALGLLLAVTLGATKLDILRIADYIPPAEKVETVSLDASGPSLKTSDPEDIETLLRLQSLALEDRLEDFSIYFLTPEGTPIPLGEASDLGYDLANEDYDWTTAGHFTLRYTLKSGKKITRQYNIWTESEAGDIVRELTSRWDVVNGMTYSVRGQEVKALDAAMESFRSFSFSEDRDIPESIRTDIGNARGLIEAVQRDCEEGSMAQDSLYHIGYFRFPSEDAEEGYIDRSSLWISISGERYTWDVRVYPECRNTIAYLKSLSLTSFQLFHERPPRY